MRLPTRTLAVALVAIALSGLIAGPAHAEKARVTFGGERRTDLVEITEIGGITYFRVADLARAIGATRHWDPRTRKMALVAGDRVARLTVDNSFVTLDEIAYNIRRPVRLVNGVFWVPVTFVTEVLGPASNSEIVWNRDEHAVSVNKLGAALGRATIGQSSDGTMLTIRMSDVAKFETRSVKRNRIELTVPGASLSGDLSIQQGVGLIESVLAEETLQGVTVLVSVAEQAATYRAELYRDPNRVELTVKAAPRAEFPEPGLRGPKRMMTQESDVLGRGENRLDTIMIDAGHGGRDNGSTGPTGLTEKEANLAVAKELRRLLQREGFYVFMTRTSDSFVSLTRRPEMANLALADLFVSIHCNSWHARSPGGFEIYFHEPGSPGADEVARHENMALAFESARASDDPETHLLWQGAHGRFVDDSRKLAQAIHGEMTSSMPHKNRGVRGGDFVALTGCYMPAVLIEVGYLSNWDEEALLRSSAFQEKVAKAIGRGIMAYTERVAEERR